MDDKRFKELAAKAADCDDINVLCLLWLGGMAELESPKVRKMLMNALSIVRSGLDSSIRHATLTD